MEISLNVSFSKETEHHYFFPSGLTKAQIPLQYSKLSQLGAFYRAFSKFLILCQSAETHTSEFEALWSGTEVENVTKNTPVVYVCIAVHTFKYRYRLCAVCQEMCSKDRDQDPFFRK